MEMTLILQQNFILIQKKLTYLNAQSTHLWTSFLPFWISFMSLNRVYIFFTVNNLNFLAILGVLLHNIIFSYGYCWYKINFLNWPHNWQHYWTLMLIICLLILFGVLCRVNILRLQIPIITSLSYYICEDFFCFYVFGK